MSALTDPLVAGLVLAALALVGVFLVASTYGVRLAIGEARLPAAVRLAELDSVLGAKEERNRYLKAQIAEKEKRLAERDYAEGEAEHWRSVVAQLKAEWENLGNQRREIETLREEHRQAVEALASKEAEVRALDERLVAARREAEEAEARREEAEDALVRAQAEAAKLEAQTQEKRDALEALDARNAALASARDDLARDVEAFRERLSGQRAEEERLSRETMRLAAELKVLEAEYEGIQDAVANLRPLQEEAQAARDALDEARDKLEIVHAEEARLQARIARLREEAGGFDRGGGEAGDPDVVLADLRTVPACLGRADGTGPVPIWEAPRETITEYDALLRVRDLLSKSGLDFPERTINAFHTSLKTAVISPLTVLAGISGTGKSQLPRRYADAMGMHFLKIPVQPRWDSPQDLFGFYNYIEKRYKPTELARALVHLDPYNWAKEAEPFADRMLLVLLDEMNLARVEYYFSEFLSRLEGRPSDARAGEPGERLPAEIDIDIPRRGQPLRVYAGQNVLFVGTMNEDESTLALSDKVLDRANVLRFPKPKALKNEIPAMREGALAGGYLQKQTFLGKWTRTADKMDASLRGEAEKVVEEINGCMERLGRPFGHRMSQAMLHYVANYPVRDPQRQDMARVENGLADQIEQRILPKLRGLDVATHGKTLEAIATIAGDRLKDVALGEAIGAAVRESRALGLFTWRGFTR